MQEGLSGGFCGKECRLFFNSPLDKHSADLANRHKARTPSPLSLCRFTKNYESHTAILPLSWLSHESKDKKCRHCEKIRRIFVAIQKK